MWPAVQFAKSRDKTWSRRTASREGIRLLNRLSPAVEFTTLVHEYAHQLMHTSDDRPTARDRHELEAEAVTFVVGGAIGLDTAVASADYISL